MAILFALHLALMAERSPAPKLSGGFIQLSNAAMNLKRDDWLAISDAMKVIGFETIIIQSVEYVGDDGVPYAFFEKDGIDPIAEMLRHAETRGMKVFIGLRLDQKWDQIRKDGTSIDKLLSVNQSTADQVWARYGSSTAFGGFYIPQELANYDYSDAEIDLLKRYFGPLGQHCRTISGAKPVAISPYFNPDLNAFTAPKRFAEDMKKILDGSAIGELMLQDGVGVREVQEAEIEAKVVPFYREMAAALGPDQRLWGNVECLEHRHGKDFPVTDFARFATQRRAVGQVVEKLVTFEFFHYMNPFGHLMSNADYIQAEKSLYDAYRQEVVGRGGGAQ